MKERERRREKARENHKLRNKDIQTVMRNGDKKYIAGDANKNIFTYICMLTYILSGFIHSRGLAMHILSSRG